MFDENVVTRREFTLEWALAILSGVAITVTGCGKDSPTAPSPPAADRTGVVSANHGHSAVITGAQITAANTLSLNIQGTATHPHTVDLTQAEVTQIGRSQQLAKASSTDAGHSHTITFN